MLIIQYQMQFIGPPRRMMVQLTQLRFHFMHYYPLNITK